MYNTWKLAGLFFTTFLSEGCDKNIHIDIIPSGEVKDSYVCRVCAYHQVRLTHTEYHRVALCFGESQKLLHGALKKDEPTMTPNLW